MLALIDGLSLQKFPLVARTNLPVYLSLTDPATRVDRTSACCILVVHILTGFIFVLLADDAHSPPGTSSVSVCADTALTGLSKPWRQGVRASQFLFLRR